MTVSRPHRPTQRPGLGLLNRHVDSGMKKCSLQAKLCVDLSTVVPKAPSLELILTRNHTGTWKIANQVRISIPVDSPAQKPLGGIAVIAVAVSGSPGRRPFDSFIRARSSVALEVRSQIASAMTSKPSMTIIVGIITDASCTMHGRLKLLWCTGIRGDRMNSAHSAPKTSVPVAAPMKHLLICSLEIEIVTRTHASGS